ncbi:MAG TPA: MFS transporter [Stellaceae bacterium]
MTANDRAGVIAGRAHRHPARAPAVRAGRGLVWLNLFVANIQTGFGPFVAVYLTTEGWNQTRIGLALSLGTISAMASQLPAGALVDVIRNKAAVAFLSILAFAGSALLFALWPTPLSVYLAEALHGFSSCTLGPAIAAMSLIIAGHRGLGLRLGRNARYAAIGNGIGAALMGGCGYYFSNRSVFFLTAVLSLGALLPLLPLAQLDQAGRPPPPRAASARGRSQPISHVLTNRALLSYACLAMLFTLGNAAMLPLAGNLVTRQAASEGVLLIAAGIVLPQIVAAVLSTALGRLAEARGRRLVLFLGFCTLPIRAALFVYVKDPGLIVLVQALDGIAGAAIGIIGPLVTADVAAKSGHYNLALGLVGFAIGIGATFSTGVAGWIADQFGGATAFYALAAVGLAATALVWVVMPETRSAEADKAR